MPDRIGSGALRTTNRNEDTVNLLYAFLGAFTAYMTVVLGVAIYRAGQKNGAKK